MFPRRRMARAERALSRGNTERAARKFHQAADGFERRGEFGRSAAVRVEAAYAEAMGGEAARAVQSTGYALTTLSKLGPVTGPNVRFSLGQVTPAIQRVAEVLRQEGHAAEAGEVERLLGQAYQAAGVTGEPPAAPAPAAAPVHADLPATCSACGGPLLPDVVEWRGPTTAICPFCGSVVKAK